MNSFLDFRKICVTSFLIFLKELYFSGLLLFSYFLYKRFLFFINFRILLFIHGTSCGLTVINFVGIQSEDISRSLLGKVSAYWLVSSLRALFQSNSETLVRSS